MDMRDIIVRGGRGSDSSTKIIDVFYADSELFLTDWDAADFSDPDTITKNPWTYEMVNELWDLAYKGELTIRYNGGPTGYIPSFGLLWFFGYAKAADLTFQYLWEDEWRKSLFFEMKVLTSSSEESYIGVNIQIENGGYFSVTPTSL